MTRRRPHAPTAGTRGTKDTKPTKALTKVLDRSDRHWSDLGAPALRAGDRQILAHTHEPHTITRRLVCAGENLPPCRAKRGRQVAAGRPDDPVVWASWCALFVSLVGFVFLFPAVARSARQ